jgi:4-amino-4-deoxy-L-arabinose transferase-like glycosyltransferase
LDQKVEHSNDAPDGIFAAFDGERSCSGWLVLLIALLIFLGGVLSPPALMDDVDSVQAQISRNMVDSGDWVIAHLDGVPYLEKSPLIYWLICASYKIFGVHDWSARLPVAFAALLLVWLTSRYARWAFGGLSGFYSGIVLATCVGLFLFTRIQIPDVMLTAAVALAFWSFQRAIDPEEPRARTWAAVLAVSLGVGLLLKGLIAIVFPIGGILVYLMVTRKLLEWAIWRKLHLFTGAIIALLIAAPWHVLATLRMPPHLNFSLHSGPGEYHGFFWFYFVNEHVLRFLNLRYPRDYNTVPRLAFWLLHLVWLFPWSVYFPAAFRLSCRPADRAGKTRLLALCWAGFVMVFFTLSTTQEYYSMPIYPALAMLLGCALASESTSRWRDLGTRVLGSVLIVAALAMGILLFLVRGVPAPGDISRALTHHPEAYSLSMGHMGDLTLSSFAYLRLPLILAGAAFLTGGILAWVFRGRRVYLAFALMMVLFLHASRLALIAFDPYLSSKPLAEALVRAPKGQLVSNGEYYLFSSVYFYTNRTALLWNGRVNNLEYGSYAPGSPAVFIDDRRFAELWASSERYYVLSDGEGLVRLRSAIDADRLHLVAESGGKTLYCNLP